MKIQYSTAATVLTITFHLPLTSRWVMGALLQCADKIWCACVNQLLRRWVVSILELFRLKGALWSLFTWKNKIWVELKLQLLGEVHSIPCSSLSKLQFNFSKITEMKSSLLDHYRYKPVITSPASASSIVSKPFSPYKFTQLILILFVVDDFKVESSVFIKLQKTLK